MELGQAGPGWAERSQAERNGPTAAEPSRAQESRADKAERAELSSQKQRRGCKKREKTVE